MKDKPARALAIIALVFMAIFLASFTATLVDYTLLNGGIGIIALCSGVFVLMVLIALKADGRGFSLTKMKNESEMQKIEQALKEQEEREKASAENAKAEEPEANKELEAENDNNASEKATANASDTDEPNRDRGV